VGRMTSIEVPVELAPLSQWVTWSWEERDGKRTKPPYNPRSGEHASSTDPRTWSSLAGAQAARSTYAGIGFVLTEHDPFAGVDLDHCRHARSGVLAPWAREIVEALASYTEITPSLEGLRIFVRATLPPGGRKHGPVEMYDRARYLTVTGQHLAGTPRTIEERTEALGRLHARIFAPAESARRNGHEDQIISAPHAGAPSEPDDARLLERARAARNGAQFSRLWAGDTAGFPSHSEGDLALCNALAFWTGRDATRMDRFFRQSGLYRPKWDARHFGDGRTYGQETIDKAIQACHSVYTPRAELSPAALHATTTVWDGAIALPEFLQQAEAIVDFLEPRLLVPGAVTEVFAPRGLGKTHAAYAIGLRLARAGRRVLLVDRDNPQSEIRRRMRRWGGSDAAHFKLIARDKAPALTDAAAWSAFPLDTYDVVIIDSIDASTEGVGEGDSAKPSVAFAAVLDLARRADGPAIMVLGNVIKSGSHSRGSGVLEDRADIVYEVRDATDLKPTGQHDWWHELAPSGVGEWAQRASRRKRRPFYRLAFIASKFRLGEEPDPFVLEVDHRPEPWTLRDVTDEIVEAGQAALQNAASERDAATARAREQLLSEMRRRADSADGPLTQSEAVVLIQSAGLKRATARNLVAQGVEERLWYLTSGPARGGKGGTAVFVSQTPCEASSAARTSTSESSRQTTIFAPEVHADRMNTGRSEPEPSKPAIHAAASEKGFVPPSPHITPGESDGVNLDAAQPPAEWDQ
jgi:hypothetical protein